MTRLSIGEFARASGLSPKALRIYDELGLLPPAYVDPHSGYRFYERSQLDRARLVAWLRALGMPLTRIRVVCDLPPLAAAADIRSYWRQVEADVAARGELVTFLVDHLTGRETEMDGTPLSIELATEARAERGLVRETNQDAVYAGRHLFAVADGFGAKGTDRPASQAALDALAALDADVPLARLLDACGEAANQARAAVHDFVASEPEREQAGTTLTAMLWSGDRFALAHVGDSRAYLLRDGELTRLTHDHSYVQSLIDEGRLTPEEAAVHPERATLIRALHGDGAAEPDLHLRDAHAGDRYLLCTDGLHGVLGDQRIRDVLGAAGAPREAADHLSGLVHTEGAPDNVACVVVDVSASR